MTASGTEPVTPESVGGEPDGQRLRVLVCSLVAVEAAALAAGAAVLLGQAATGDSAGGSDSLSTGAILAMAALVAAVGGGLAVCAWGVFQRARWTRGPVLTWQLLQAGVGVPLSTSQAWWLGAPILALSVLVGVLIAGRHVLGDPRG